MHTTELISILKNSNLNIFSIYDAAKIIGKPLPYTSLFLSKAKGITRIEKGKYFINDTDIYEIASNIVYPSYISMQAALRYYDLIDQNIIDYSVISVKRHKKLSIGRSKVEFIYTDRRKFFGYVKNGNSYIASIEKLFIDLLYFNNVKFSDVNEAYKYAYYNKLINISKLEKYALEFGKSTIISKLGFMMEINGFHSKKLIKHRYRNNIILHGSGIKGVDKLWGISYD